MEHKTKNQINEHDKNSPSLDKSNEATNQEEILTTEKHSETHEKHSPLDQFKIKEIYPIHIGNVNLSFTKPAIAHRIYLNCFPKGITVDIWPEHIHKNKFGIYRLPRQKVRCALLSGRT